MASDFSRTLALLRHEKKISQRNAAADLQVSQALLSHYENGLREPGLRFVARAAEYYNVSCDYLLGRSMSRGENASSDAADSFPFLQHDVSQELSPEAADIKKQIEDAVTILIDAADSSGSKQLLHEVAMYFSFAEYKLFRYLYAADGSNPPEAFRTSADRFDALCDALLKLTELRIRCAAEGGGCLGLQKEDVQLSGLALSTLPYAYPQYADSLLQILQTVSDSLEEFDGSTQNRK